jgi:hypothetical protein
MICFAKPGLIEDLYIVQKEEFSITCYMCNTYTWQRRSLFVREKHILSSEGMIHKDYDNKGLFLKKKVPGRESQRDWRQDELIGDKPPVVK